MSGFGDLINLTLSLSLSRRGNLKVAGVTEEALGGVRDEGVAELDLLRDWTRVPRSRPRIL